MNKLVRYSKLFFKRNAATVLTCIGGVGVVVTSVMAIKATPKALVRIEEAREEKGEQFTKFEIVQAAGSAYIPAIVVGTTTVACIFAANVLNKRQQASLVSAYTLVDSSYKAYKGKLKELYGEEVHQNVVNAVAVEKAVDMRITAANFGSSCDLSIEENDAEPRIFYDEHSGRCFESTIERVMSAEYHLNRNYTLRGYSYLNEFYEFLGIDTTDYGSVMGWAYLDDGMQWIDFNHRKAVLDDGSEFYVIEMPFAPSYDFFDEY